MPPTPQSETLLRAALARLRRPGLPAADDRIVPPVRRRDRLESLIEAMLVVGSGLELEVTLTRIVHAALELLDCRLGAVAVLDRAGGAAAEFVSEGVDEQTRGLIRKLLRERRRPLRIDDLSRHAHAVGFPGNQPSVRTFLGAPILVRDELLGHLCLAEKSDGKPFTGDDEVMVQALAAAAGAAVENARLYEEAQLRELWQEATCEIRAALLGSAETIDVLRLVADRARVLADADHAFVALLVDPDIPLEEGAKLVVTVAAGLDADLLTGREIPVEGSCCGQALAQEVPLRASTLADDVSAGLDEGFGPGLVLPLRAGKDAVFGVLVTVRKTGERPFDARLVSLAAAFADQAAIALQRADDQRRLNELRVEGERDRIARDLHDHVIQRLFAHGLALEGTLRRADSDDVQTQLAERVDDVQGIIGDIRAAIFDLHSGLRDALPGGGVGRLRRRLREVIEEVTAESGLRTTIRMSGPIGVAGPELAEHGEAVVREAVTNVVHHAKASAVIVTVSLADDLLINVTDDGFGIPPWGDGSGLRDLAKRAEKAGGEFSVKALTSGGTQLVWSAPVTP